jgi:hypothetical protein
VPKGRDERCDFSVHILSDASRPNLGLSPKILAVLEIAYHSKTNRKRLPIKRKQALWLKILKRQTRHLSQTK